MSALVSFSGRVSHQAVSFAKWGVRISPNLARAAILSAAAGAIVYGLNRIETPHSRWSPCQGGKKLFSLMHRNLSHLMLKAVSSEHAELFTSSSFGDSRFSLAIQRSQSDNGKAERKFKTCMFASSLAASVIFDVIAVGLWDVAKSVPYMGMSFKAFIIPLALGNALFLIGQVNGLWGEGADGGPRDLLNVIHYKWQ